MDALRKASEAPPRRGSANKAVQAFKQCQESAIRKIAEAFACVSADNRADEIRNIVEKASSMSLNFGAQKARIILYFPQRDEILAGSADSVGSVNGGTFVCFGVSPGIKKYGNIRGLSMEQVSYILDAKAYGKESK